MDKLLNSSIQSDVDPSSEITETEVIEISEHKGHSPNDNIEESEEPGTVIEQQAYVEARGVSIHSVIRPGSQGDLHDHDQVELS